MNTRSFLAFCVVASSACGGPPSDKTPASATTTIASAPVKSAPEPVETKVDPAPAPAVAAEEPKEVVRTADACDASWGSCVNVGLDRKVEKRATQLIGDPAVSETKSGTTDGRTPVTITLASGDVVQVALKRKPNDKNEVTVRFGKGDKLGAEVVADKRDGSANDFTHIGVIVSEAGGKAMIDIRYMR